MLKLIILSVGLLSLTGCSGVDFKSWHFPYYKPVQQGTYLTKEQIQQIKIGDSKEQVQQILGEPLSEDTFTQNIWRFLYSEYTNNQKVKSYQVIISFTDNNVDNLKISGELFK